MGSRWAPIAPFPLVGAIGLVLGAIGMARGVEAKEEGPSVRTWLSSGPSERCVDVVFIGDGYQKKHLSPEGKYWIDVKRYASRLLEEAPFSWYRDKFNVRAVMLESTDEGCDDNEKAEKKRKTALGSTFDTRDGRLLYFTDAAALERAVKVAGPVDIAFVMVNTERYGGSGTVLAQVKVRDRPLPAPTFAARDTPSFLIAIHELGHSFAGLADEYDDPRAAITFPLPKGDADLAEPNVTLASHIDLKDRASLARTAKWAHFLKLPGGQKPAWAHEGGHFRLKGVYRPWPACKMLKTQDPYCPICCEEVAKAIFTACGEIWDDDAFHKAHPLSLWK